MKTYWANLNERERWILGSGVGFCCVYLFYLLIYSPLTTAIHNKSQQLIEKQETLEWMQGVLQSYEHRKVPKTLTSAQLLSVLAEQLNASSFKQYPYELQQTGNATIQLRFEQVPYNLFMNWLWSTYGKYTLVVKQLSLTRTKTPGVVKLNLTVSTVLNH